MKENRIKCHAAILIEVELGAPLTELFSSFIETPLAAATIAQVHEATMQDGRHVAVKVQRPGLETMISTDIRLISRIINSPPASPLLKGRVARLQLRCLDLK